MYVKCKPTFILNKHHLIVSLVRNMKFCAR